MGNIKANDAKAGAMTSLLARSRALFSPALMLRLAHYLVQPLSYRLDPRTLPDHLKRDVGFLDIRNAGEESGRHTSWSRFLDRPS
ncbi:hypothetical protein [Chelativorans sp.]|uniref:hypothetical protein n=1 Tax=Chelativorans sp. TaxID=2203393 RepID=UPI002810D456|nr:hypothetical protein [Chelativorans sp.]